MISFSDRYFGVTIEGIHTETGPGVYESSIQYSDGVSAADRGALFKNGVKELSPRHELIPTFMAKWNADLPGCSGHIHQSLIDAEASESLFPLCLLLLLPHRCPDIGVNRLSSTHRLR